MKSQFLFFLIFIVFGCNKTKNINPNLKEQSYWIFKDKKYEAINVEFGNSSNAFFPNGLIGNTICFDATKKCIESLKQEDSSITIEFSISTKPKGNIIYQVIPGDYAFQNEKQCHVYIYSPEYLPSLGRTSDKIEVTTDKNGKIKAIFKDIYLGWPNKTSFPISGILVEN